MLREIITPKERSVTVLLPEEMIGKTVELIAFEVAEKEKKLTRPQRLKRIESLTESTLVDLSGFTFNRDEANDYEE